MVNFTNLVLSAATLAAQALAAPVAPQDDNAKIQAKAGEVIAGKYIITLKSDIPSSAFESHMSWVSQVHARGTDDGQLKGVENKFTGDYGFNGYVGSFNEATLAEIKANPDVAAVEEDRVWTLDWIQHATIEKRDAKSAKGNLTTQENAPWGLASVSHRSPNSTNYVYSAVAGVDTYAYVIDTGIRITHKDFEGRATNAWSAFNSTEDNVGHGTHVAGTIGGKTYGVAKKTNLLAVKVFNSRSSSTSTILAGFNWAVNDIIKKDRTKKAVLNMSLGGPYSYSYNLAVDQASASGVLSVIAAGNSGQDASTTSPASAKSAVTVAALDKNWKIASFSNYGPVVDIFGPGVAITSAGFESDSSEAIMSGTSMACPHVVGLALYAISVDGVTGVSGVTNHLLSSGTKDKIQGTLRGTPNSLANNNNPEQ